MVCGYGRFGRELVADLRAEGLLVTVIDPTATADDEDENADGVRVVVGDGSVPAVMASAGIDQAVAFVAGTENDTTNLSLLAAARRLNPSLFLAARQNAPVNAPLFRAMSVDALLIPAEVVAHEVYAQLSTPLLWRFIQEMTGRGDEWAAGVVERLRAECGDELQSHWKTPLTAAAAPAIGGWLGSGQARLGDLLRSPDDRDQRLPIVPLLVLRGDEAALTPDDEFVLRADDEILFVGEAAARRALTITLLLDATSEYVIYGQHVPASWVWRRFVRKQPLAAAGR